MFNKSYMMPIQHNVPMPMQAMSPFPANWGIGATWTLSYLPLEAYVTLVCSNPQVLVCRSCDINETQDTGFQRKHVVSYGFNCKLQQWERQTLCA